MKSLRSRPTCWWLGVLLALVRRSSLRGEEVDSKLGICRLQRTSRSWCSRLNRLSEERVKEMEGNGWGEERVGGCMQLIYKKVDGKERERPCGFCRTGEIERDASPNGLAWHFRLVCHKGWGGTPGARDQKNRERDPSNKWQIPRSPPTSPSPFILPTFATRYILASRSHKLDESCRSHFHLSLLFEPLASQRETEQTGQAESLYFPPAFRDTIHATHLLRGTGGTETTLFNTFLNDRINKKSHPLLSFSLAWDVSRDSLFHDYLHF